MSVHFDDEVKLFRGNGQQWIWTARHSTTRQDDSVLELPRPQCWAKEGF
jgi:hypothetical protein